MPTPDERTAERWNDLDAARSVLMMLGVVLHAANVYAEPQAWLVGDPPGQRAFALLSGGIHVFRIPAFFVIAGFFAAFSLERYGPGGFLRRRARRLVVPLASAAVLLGSVQSWVLYRHGAQGYGPPGGGELGLPAYLASDALRESVRAGAWVTHLWFLVNLIVYVAATYACALFGPLRRGLARGADALARAAGGRGSFVDGGLFLFILPATAVIVQGVAKAVPQAYARPLGITSLYELLAYLFPYYAFGLLAFRARPFFLALRRPGAWIVPALVAAVFAVQTLPADPTSLAESAAVTYARDLVVWLAIAVVLALFRRFTSRPSRSFAYLSEASYTIYLFHHVCVIGLGLSLVSLEQPPWMKFCAVVCATAGATLALHHLVILRVPLARFLFNGKWR